MRKDLNKQLCEHERYGSSKGFRQRRRAKEFDVLTRSEETLLDDHRYPIENYQGKQWTEVSSDKFTPHTNGYREGMKARYNSWASRKDFGENLNPLYGILEKSVGRKWDDFYSELRQVFDMRSVINQHIMLHMYQRICYRTYVDTDGEIMCVDGYSGTPERVLDNGWSYYVDPTTNVIKRASDNVPYRALLRKSRERDAAVKAQTQRKLSNTQELHLIDGVWFRVTFKNYKPDIIKEERFLGQRFGLAPTNSRRYVYTREVYPPVYDVLQKVTVYKPRVAVKKETASRKELKALGLYRYQPDLSVA